MTVTQGKPNAPNNQQSQPAKLGDAYLHACAQPFSQGDFRFKDY